MNLSAFQSFWILASNTLVHELGLPLPVMPTARAWIRFDGKHDASHALLINRVAVEYRIVSPRCQFDPVVRRPTQLSARSTYPLFVLSLF